MRSPLCVSVWDVHTLVVLIGTLVCAAAWNAAPNPLCLIMTLFKSLVSCTLRLPLDLRVRPAAVNVTQAPLLDVALKNSNLRSHPAT